MLQNIRLKYIIKKKLYTTIMKQTKLFLVILALFIIHLSINAQDPIRIAGNVYYVGKMDVNKQPIGKGNLHLVGIGKQSLDIIEGEFEGNKVTNAIVLFGISGKKPTYERDRAGKYTGTIEFEIKGNFLVYKLIKGILEIGFSDIRGYNKLSIPCQPEDSCVIKRSASFDSGIVHQDFSGYFHQENGDYDLKCILYPYRDNGVIWYRSTNVLSKAKEKQLKEAAEKELQSPNGIGKKIISSIENQNVPFSEIESQTDKLLTMDYTDELKNTVKKIIKSCRVMATGVNGDNLLSISDEGTERGQMELELIKKLQKYLADKGDANYAKRLNMTPDEVRMEELKDEAFESKDQYKYWLIAHMYEYGSGNNYDKITINLDSALVWYQKAAEIDPKNEESVKAIKYKIKTGGRSYWDDKEEIEAKENYDFLCKKFGKKFTDNALKGNIIIGMPEELMVSAFDARLVETTGNRKIYRIYGWGMTGLTNNTLSNNKHLKSVWVTNGKVTRIRNWE